MEASLGTDHHSIADAIVAESVLDLAIRFNGIIKFSNEVFEVILGVFFGFGHSLHDVTGSIRNSNLQIGLGPATFLSSINDIIDHVPELLELVIKFIFSDVELLSSSLENKKKIPLL